MKQFNLTKQLALGKKILRTTTDAVVLFSNADITKAEHYSQAYRIIRGPGQPMTTRPFVILCNDESDEDLQSIIDARTQEYPEDFPEDSEAYYVQILFDGCGDDRVQWVTV